MKGPKVRFFYQTYLIIPIVLFGCLISDQDTKEMNVNKLANRLIEIGYPKLFMYGDHSVADSIWEDGENAERLKSILLSASSSYHEKFLAAEVLRYFEVELGTQSYGVLADAYSYALENTSADRGNIAQLNGNLWGFLYELDDAGYLGERIIQFEFKALPHLKRLLNDDESILYEGSKEATIGNNYRYRVKDFAAFYISKIKNIPIKFHQDFEERDKEIERLKELLKGN